MQMSGKASIELRAREASEDSPIKSTESARYTLALPAAASRARHVNQSHMCCTLCEKVVFDEQCLYGAVFTSPM